MKRIFLWIFVIAFCTSPNFIFSQDTDKKNIAVIDLESRGGLSQSEIGTLTDRLRSMLVRTNEFDVADRGRMQNILDEQGFQMSGCTSTDCAVEAGKILGVEEMVTGTIGRLGKMYTIDVILIDVETSVIIKSLTRDYTGEIEGLLGEMRSIANELAGAGEKPVVIAKGSLHVETDPENVSVYIDGTLAGTTPFDLAEIKAGEHLLKLEKKGFKTIETSISIISGQKRTIEKNLKAIYFLSVYSTPTGAEVYLNGTKVGQTPWRGQSANETKIKIELRKENYVSWTDDFTLDETKTVRADLEFTDAYTQLLAERSRAKTAEQKQADKSSDSGGGSTWLWIGAGVVAAGAAAFLLMPQDDASGGGTTDTGFPTPVRP